MRLFSGQENWRYRLDVDYRPLNSKKKNFARLPDAKDGLRVSRAGKGKMVLKFSFVSGLPSKCSTQRGRTQDGIYMSPGHVRAQENAL